MEVHVLRHGRIPEGSMLSIRAGNVRRQAPVASGRPFRFPCKLENPVKVDILQPIATGSIVVRPGAQQYKVIFADESMLHCELEVKPYDSDAAHSSPARLKLENGDHDDANRRGGETSAASAKEYLEQHAVLEFIQAVLQTVIKDRPDDPFSAMARHFSSGYNGPEERERLQEGGPFDAPPSPPSFPNPGSPLSMPSPPAPSEPPPGMPPGGPTSEEWAALHAERAHLTEERLELEALKEQLAAERRSLEASRCRQEEVCFCGSVFLPDAVFCRMCGEKRSVKEAEVTLNGTKISCIERTPDQSKGSPSRNSELDQRSPSRTSELEKRSPSRISELEGINKVLESMPEPEKSSPSAGALRDTLRISLEGALKSGVLDKAFQTRGPDRAGGADRNQAPEPLEDSSRRRASDDPAKRSRLKEEADEEEVPMMRSLTLPVPRGRSKASDLLRTPFELRSRLLLSGELRKSLCLTAEEIEELELSPIARAGNASAKSMQNGQDLKRMLKSALEDSCKSGVLMKALSNVAESRNDKAQTGSEKNEGSQASNSARSSDSSASAPAAPPARPQSAKEARLTLSPPSQTGATIKSSPRLSVFSMPPSKEDGDTESGADSSECKAPPLPEAVVAPSIIVTKECSKSIIVTKEGGVVDCEALRLKARDYVDAACLSGALARVLAGVVASANKPPGDRVEELQPQPSEQALAASPRVRLELASSDVGKSTGSSASVQELRVDEQQAPEEVRQSLRKPLEDCSASGDSQCALATVTAADPTRSAVHDSAEDVRCHLKNALEKSCHNGQLINALRPESTSSPIFLKTPQEVPAATSLEAAAPVSSSDIKPDSSLKVIGGDAVAASTSPKKDSPNSAADGSKSNLLSPMEASLREEWGPLRSALIKACENGQLGKAVESSRAGRASDIQQSDDQMAVMESLKNAAHSGLLARVLSARNSSPAKQDQKTHAAQGASAEPALSPETESEQIRKRAKETLLAAASDGKLDATLATLKKPKASQPVEAQNHAAQDQKQEDAQGDKNQEVRAALRDLLERSYQSGDLRQALMSQKASKGSKPGHSNEELSPGKTQKRSSGSHETREIFSRPRRLSSGPELAEAAAAAARIQSAEKGRVGRKGSEDNAKIKQVSFSQCVADNGKLSTPDKGAADASKNAAEDAAKDRMRGIFAKAAETGALESALQDLKRTDHS